MSRYTPLLAAVAIVASCGVTAAGRADTSTDNPIVRAASRLDDAARRQAPHTYGCVVVPGLRSGRPTGISLRVTRGLPAAEVKRLVARARAGRYTTVVRISARYRAETMSRLIRKAQARVPQLAGPQPGYYIAYESEPEGRTGCPRVQIMVTDDIAPAAKAWIEAFQAKYGADRVSVIAAPAGSPIPA